MIQYDIMYYHGTQYKYSKLTEKSLVVKRLRNRLQVEWIHFWQKTTRIETEDNLSN